MSESLKIGSGSRVGIVGGGPAGMEAAQIASERGHQVTLYEKEKELGGALRYAAAPPFKADMKRYLAWLVRKTQQSAVDIKLGTEATARAIKAAKPDILIIAAGADPIIPDIPGVKKPNVVWAGDVDMDKVKTGDTVVVAGAGLTGCETALHIAMQGKKVTVVDMITEAEIAKDALDELRDGLMELLEKYNVKFITEVKLEEVTDKGAIIIDKAWNRTEIAADTVVLALGFKARRVTVEALKGLASERQAFVIGDCSDPGNLLAAIHDAFNIAIEI